MIQSWRCTHTLKDVVYAQVLVTVLFTPIIRVKQTLKQETNYEFSTG